MNTIKNEFFDAMLVILLSILFCSNLMGRMVVNGTELAFLPDGREQIRVNVIRGAGYYLKSQSDFLLFLNRVEMSDIEGMDFAEAQEIIDSAATNMEQAVKTYETLARQAEVTGYDHSVLPKLLNAKFVELDETGRVIDEAVYRPDARRQAESFLREGDIRGIYFRLYQETQELLVALKRIKVEVDAYRMPGNSMLWDLGRNYSETLVFGHNVADIFAQLTGK